MKVNVEAGVGRALKHFVDEVRRRLSGKIAKVVLFGSHAKGLTDEFSDIDVIVVYSGAEDEVRGIVASITFETCLRYNIPLEPIIMNIHEYNEDTLFTREVKNQGLFYTL